MRSSISILLICLASQAIAQPLLDNFLAGPFASGLAISRDGKQAAWIVNDRGHRNIFHRSATGQTKQLTSYDQDDGQEISQIVFSPDGSNLVYVRGGDGNREGYSPNPASLALGAEQAIWCVPLTGGETFRIAAGSDPVFYPDGTSILFSRGSQIQTVEVSNESNPSQLFFARGANGDARFSPDGKEVLFVSYRRDHNFIGIYTLATQQIRWIAPEVSQDQFSAWSPDGKRVAFIRTAGLKADELISFVAGRAFSIWVADAAGGKAQRVWASPGKDGGFAQSYPNAPLRWTKTDRLLFFSEHEGWDHVYSMKPDGSDLRDITPGTGEVESYSLDASGAFIYFDGNREDINRRHIWKSGVADGKVTAVTSGEGIEMYPASVGNDVFCFRSTINQNSTLVRFDGKKFESLSVATSTGFAPSAFLTPEPITFKAADGTTIHGQLFINRKVSGKRPAVIFMHGGPVRQMLLGFHYSGYYSNCYAFNQYLANSGYAVLALNYRDGIGYGRAFRQSPNQGPWGAVEYQDVVGAGKFLQGLPEVDAGKIGLWGGSYGGYLTALGMARNPELFKVGVDLHGVHDWAFRARDFSPGGGWAISGKDMETAYKNSPVNDIGTWAGPVLLVCGDDDRNVLFQETTDLAERLRERKVHVEILTLPDEVHGFLRYASWSTVFEHARDFFDRKLKAPN